MKYAIRAAFTLSPKFVKSVATLARRRRDKIWKKSHHRRETKIARVAAAFLAYGTRARSARGSQNRAILSIVCPFTGNSAFRLCVSIYTVERKRFKSLFAKLTQINTLSIRFCRLLTLDSKIPPWIRLRLVRKSTNKSQSTTAYVRILLADNPSLLTKKLPQNVLNGFLALY